MSVSTVVKTAAQGVISLADGTGTPVTLTVPYTRGDLTAGPLPPKLNELVKIEARGKKVGLAYGNRVWPTVSFSAWLPNVASSSASAPGSLAEFLAALNAYSGNVSTSGAGRPVTVNITLTVEGTSLTDSADETWVFKDVHCSITPTEAMDGNTLAIQGEICGDIVFTNSSGTVTYSQIS